MNATSRMAAMLVLALTVWAGPAAADKAELAALVKERPGWSPQRLAQESGMGLDSVTAGLVEMGRVPIAAERFVEVWTRLLDWESPLVIAIVAGSVLEIHGRLKGGEFGRGYYNLGDVDAGLSGHLKPDAMGAIYATTSTRNNNATHQVVFYDTDGGRVFSVYINRVEDGSHHPQTLAQFQNLKADYQALALGDS